MKKNQFTPLISVVIPAYNEEEYIADCIKSVKKQKTNLSYEIIVVDNNSSDKTSSIAKKNGAKVVFEEKQGLSYARQAGLDAAKGKFLIYLDADTRIAQGWLVEVINYLNNNPEVSGISCSFYFYDGNIMTEIGRAINYYLVAPLINFILISFNKPETIWGPSIITRTELLRKAGGINLDFVFYGEDTSIAYRLHSQGKVRFLKHFFVYTSARRYKYNGGAKTLMVYTIASALIHMGMYEKAKAFSEKYSKKHMDIYKT